MATALYRIGHFAYRRAWLVIGVWVVLLGAILGGGVALGGQTQESYAIPGTESQDSIDKLAAVFPAAAGAQVQAVYTVPSGASVTDAPYRTAIEDMATVIEGIAGVNAVISPYSEYASNAISSDEQTAFTQVQLTGPSTDVVPSTLQDLTDTATLGEKAGLEVAFGGQVFQDNTFGITITEIFGVLFAGVVLLITFGSLMAAGMPLLMALIGVGVAIGGITTISAFVPVSSTAPMLALMLGLAVGIDYSLFILSRHRTQMATGESPHESAATAVATAGSAVVFAGLTVIIALLGLLVVGIPFLSVMGVGAAFAVLVSIAVAVTLLPALLGLAGARLAPKPGGRAHRRATTPDTGRPTLGRRWVGLVLKAPIVAAILVVGVLGTLAIPALSLDLNLPDGASEPAGSTQLKAYQLIEQGFGPGYNGPLIVVVDITQTTEIFPSLDAIGAEIRTLPDVAYVGTGTPNPSVDTAIIQVMPGSAPDAPETKVLVQAIRDLGPGIDQKFGTPITVTGATAVGIDISNRLTGALIPFALIVVGLSIVLLTMVFRSLFVPIKAALGFLLSVFAALGVTVAIFQWGWFADVIGVENPGPILSFLPILLMAVLFGLAMDYEVFLVSGMREEFVKTGNARQSVIHGFSHAGRVVTAAALIMFFVFFAFVPEGTGAIKGIAFALAIGVFLDAFLVRMTLVPAAMALAGKAAWWIPAWLARLLPNVDIEGEGLRRHLLDNAWATEQSAAITAEEAVFGVADTTIGPLSFNAARGSVLRLGAPASARRVIAATFAGRLDPVSGRLQVAGSPLPSERGRALRSVALAEVAADTGQTLGDVVTERVLLSRPWYRGRTTRATVNTWIGRLNAVRDSGLEPAEPVTRDTLLASLSGHDRALAAVTAALAENPAVLVVDLGDALPEDSMQRDLQTVLADLVPSAVTLVIAATAFNAEALAWSSRRGTSTLTLTSTPADDSASVDGKVLRS
ncbi:MMPL family transporter [Cryobacterium psychrophilum]|uniref:MMPL family transporter n=1 Tax=Cryobacterium psychrophilum TaxID=41988 RepID=A0A4Y8KLY2_9MICO|nr:MMPL family transporter [Cryobacterium psychrophilum]TDW31131.1 RND superfamily putative drug exporter [Cryobacterium psychrophilum]TFD78573.1 MMPL family transporter [Cryobacterium psychrophilum]